MIPRPLAAFALAAFAVAVLLYWQRRYVTRAAFRVYLPARDRLSNAPPIPAESYAYYKAFHYDN